MKLISKKRILNTFHALLDQLPKKTTELYMPKEARRQRKARGHIKHLVIRADRSNTDHELREKYRYVYNELLRRARNMSATIKMCKVVSIGSDGIMHLHCVVFSNADIDALFEKPLKKCWIDTQKETTKNLKGLVDYIYDTNLVKSIPLLQKRFSIRKYITLPIVIVFNTVYRLFCKKTDNVLLVPVIFPQYRLLTATSCIFNE